MENSVVKKRINRMFGSEKGKYSFITLSALSFGIKLETLGEMLEMDTNELYNALYKNDVDLMSSLRFLFEHGIVDQLVARTNFEDYLNKLYLAFIRCDKKAIENLLKQIRDSEIIELQKRRKSRSNYKLTDQDIILLAKYQVKYGVSSSAICAKFHINHNTYMNRVLELSNEFHTLKSNVLNINDFFEKSYETRRYNG